MRKSHLERLCDFAVSYFRFANNKASYSVSGHSFFKQMILHKVFAQVLSCNLSKVPMGNMSVSPKPKKNLRNI